MLKVKPKFPHIDPNSNSQQNQGVNNKAANGDGDGNSRRSTKSKNGHLHEKNLGNNYASANLKAKISGKVNTNFGLALGRSKHLNFSANSIVSLNPKSQNFSFGLNQNLQIAVTILFDALTPNSQSLLKGFTSQEIVSSLFLNAGIQSEIGGNPGLQNKTITLVQNNPVLGQIFTILTKDNPLIDPAQRIIDLWNNSGGIFSDCGCVITVKDLQIIAARYAKALQNGDINTLVKLTEFLQQGQSRSEKDGEKFSKLLSQLIGKGEIVAIKNAQLASSIALKNTEGLSVNRTAPQVTQKADKAATSNISFGLKDQIFIAGRTNAERKDFYTEKTENTLRKQLEFYPHYAYDRQISAFEDTVDISLVKQEFVEKRYDEIDDWLKTGKHRLVKDFEFDKPIGMVVERGESGFITADKLRIVLVRDGSVEGWHFLRSFLIS